MSRPKLDGPDYDRGFLDGLSIGLFVGLVIGIAGSLIYHTFF